jgi:hypothetical protein
MSYLSYLQSSGNSNDFMAGLDQDWTKQIHLGDCFNLTLDIDTLPENIPIRFQSDVGYSDDIQVRV